MTGRATATTASLRTDLDRWIGKGCARCGVRLCGHAILGSVALGLKDAPRCVKCLAEGLHCPASEWVSQLVDYVQRRDCFRTAWEEACDREGLARSPLPKCLGEFSSQSTVTDSVPWERSSREPDAIWDAGTMGCGELVLHLRQRLRAMAPGEVLRLFAHDPGATEDLPAWCRLTGHRLLRADPPVFDILRKEET